MTLLVVMHHTLDHSLSFFFIINARLRLDLALNIAAMPQYYYLTRYICQFLIDDENTNGTFSVYYWCQTEIKKNLHEKLSDADILNVYMVGGLSLSSSMQW